MSKFKSERLEGIIKSTNDDTIKSVLFNLRLVPTFSLMIEATFQPIQSFLVGEYPTLTTDDVTAIAVAATCQFIFKSYDRLKQGKELKTYLESRDLEIKVDQTKKKLTKLLKIGSDVLKDLGYTTGTMSGILGFAFVLHPLMLGLSEIMGRNSDFNIDNIFNYIVLGIAFKGSLTLEQFLKKFTETFEKSPDIGPKEEEWPKDIMYGEKRYVMIKKSKDRVTYEHEKYKGDKLTFKTKKEMSDFIDDYTEPKGGTQSTQLGGEYLSESQLKGLIDSIIL
mgnify:FL=1|tara:strand:+ start:3555 stop:4391 length:837 start_codon:yes stop_codon:yes gene_type:complete